MWRKIFFLVVFIMVQVSLWSTPPWVETYGTSIKYRLPVCISGYGESGVSDTTERFAAAKATALSQISHQIRIQVISNEVLSTVDDGESMSVRYVNNIQTASDITISGARFDRYTQTDKTYVLAWVETSALYTQFLQDATIARDQLDGALKLFDEAINSGKVIGVEEFLYDADRYLVALLEATSVLRALQRWVTSSSAEDTILLTNSINKELMVRQRWNQLKNFKPTGIQEAADVLSKQLSAQLNCNTQIMPLFYQDADFSSVFGNRMADSITTALFTQLKIENDEETVIIKGNYWIDLESIEILLVARSAQTGKIVATARTALPKTSVDASTLIPSNMDKALKDGVLLLGDQIINGGLDVEVWTDKGRNESALVFTEGEFVQFYFKVNQPAFLQLSYVLVTGDVVVLKESFYIGIDRVNRVVALPYRFQVVPPFGVERLIVTAHSETPPKPNVKWKKISGQWYEVFQSVGEAVAQMRGLALAREHGVQNSQFTRVGETGLSITTIKNEQ